MKYLKIDKNLEKDPDFVVILEDENDACFLLTRLLSKRGYRTICLNSVSKGRKLLALEKPFALILDVNIHDENGLSLLKECELPISTRVIVMSADSHFKKPALELGADAFLEKPFSIKLLISTLENDNPINSI